MEMDKNGIKLHTGKYMVMGDESSSTTYELTLLYSIGSTSITFKEKPSDEFVEQLISLTGAYKATLKEVITNNKTYRGEDPNAIYIKHGGWQQWAMIAEDEVSKEGME
ncbi:hypothetical protein PHRODO_171 [Bacillus phage Phrodo]|uniref:hypothetical protein n=1 Tax=Bacillus phage Phrodo TaxID=1805953 RepID=UPI0007A76CF8|nr:hypothetical protein BI003_gp171 [Bacillus phage Phrodo]AMW62212.1 hypothetical protein PHRODO_171 [Bacillus phage Phrodo]UGO48982.1 hypothetical protein JARJAR_168 [Bacillus phage vB_BanH_JarJar]UGO50472.1 hypothetical protein RONSWANSON_166 [Bacillus phage vB_BanH_RonSwanson]